MSIFYNTIPFLSYYNHLLIYTLQYINRNKISIYETKLLLASLVLSIGTLSAQNYQISVSEKNEPMMKGKFQPTWKSLENYQVPEWFKNAKFGIWAHWGPQCVEGSGDWMARSMYLEGTSEYKHHVEHYGHPSEVGFKDIIPLFKAENWNPDELVAFYKKIGAQYFLL